MGQRAQKLSLFDIDVKNLPMMFKEFDEVTKQLNKPEIPKNKEVLSRGKLFREQSKIINFPSAYTMKKPAPMPEPVIRKINAPYGAPLPDGITDFRPMLQRDGLILISWEKHIATAGEFYNILWCKTAGKRYTCSSGHCRKEELLNVLPGDYDLHKFGSRWNNEKLVYIVQVAPETVLEGPVSDFPKYIQSLKEFGLTNNFDYNYNWRAEKQQRYLTKNKELIALKIPTRIITVLNDKGIFTIDTMRAVSIKEIRTIKNIGEKTINEFLAVLERNNITIPAF